MDIGNSSSNRAHPQKHYRHYAPLQEHRKPQNASKLKRPFLLAQAVPLASLSPWLHPSYLLNKDLHRRTLPSLTTLVPRSEEHTSELQSRENLVCRLLLEKTND